VVEDTAAASRSAAELVRGTRKPRRSLARNLEREPDRQLLDRSPAGKRRERGGDYPGSEHVVGSP
jgi:hypothetical protein